MGAIALHTDVMNATNVRGGTAVVGWADRVGLVTRQLTRIVASASTCIGCGRRGGILCAPCSATIERADTALVLPGGVPLRVGFVYSGIVRTALVSIKQRGATHIARLFTRTFAESLRTDPGTLIVPLPNSREGWRRRGFTVVSAVLKGTGIRTHSVLVLRDRGTQQGRGRTERSQHRAGHIVVNSRANVRGRRVILIDDVVTTGATMTAAIVAIRAAGGVVVACAALAVVRPQRFTASTYGVSTTNHRRGHSVNTTVGVSTA